LERRAKVLGRAIGLDSAVVDAAIAQALIRGGDALLALSVAWNLRLMIQGREAVRYPV
jgi:hypothetical protein